MTKFAAFFLVVAMLVALAAPAHADDLIVSCERTVSTTERPALTVRSTLAGPIAVRLLSVNRPDRFFLGADDLRRPEGVEKAFAAYMRASDASPTRNQDLVGGQPRVVPYAAVAVRARVEFDPMGAGLYVIEAVQGELKVRALLLVSDLALVTKRDATGLLVWAVHRATGAPWPGAGARATDGARGTQAAMTGPDGLARLAGSFAPEVTVYAHDGRHWAFGSERWYPADVPARRVFLVAHQPAYRPGERVEVRGVVRAVDAEGRPVLDPSVTSARLLFVGPRDRILEQQDVNVSADLGTLAGGFDLPKDSPTGACEARVEIGGKEYAAPFLVDAYRAPPFEVRAVSAAPRVLAGEKVKFTVTAKGFDGSKLPGAAVTWSLVHHRVERGLFDSDEFARLFFGTERDAFAPTTLANGTDKLNAEGTLEIEAPVAKDLLDGYLTLQATVVGPSGLHVAGSGVCGVSTAPLMIALKTDRHLYGPEDQTHVTIRVQQADGKPAEGFGGRLTWTLDGIGRETREPKFVTDARGEARVDLSLGRRGYYTIIASPTLDVDGMPPLRGFASFWVVGENATLGYAGERLDVIADKDDYAVGDTAKILVLTPWKQRPLLATLEGATLLDARVLTPAGDSVLYTLALTEAHAPNVWVAFTAIDQGNLVTGTRMLRIPPVTRRLVTTVTPDQLELGPGATSGAMLEVRDHAGQPVAGAEVSLAVVDEALHSLFPNAGVSIEAFFNPLRRNSVATGGPLHLATLGHAHFSPPAKSYGPTAGRPYAPGSPAPAPAPAEVPAPDPARDAAGAGEEGAAGLACGAPDRNRDSSTEFKKRADGAGANSMRADFRMGAHWAPALRTGADGRVRAEGIRYADTLTRWRLTAIAVDAQTRVGTGTGEVRTKRDLAIEVTLPRFLLVGDRAEAPVHVTNLTDAELTGGGYVHWAMQPISDEGGKQPQLRLVPGVATRNSMLEIRPKEPGTVHVLGRASAGRFSDGIERSIPVLPQGFETSTGLYVEAESRVGQPSRALLSLEIPKDLDRTTLKAWLSVEPTALAAVARALPYLVGYPHGCTEQTLSRFEPLIIVADVAEELEIPPRGVLAEVPAMVRAGVARLAALQHEDGGFGWWPNDASNLEMTVRAVRALARVTQDDVAEQAAALRAKALDHLGRRVSERDDPHHLFVLLALAEAGRLPVGRGSGLDLWHDVVGDPGRGSVLRWAALLLADVATKRQDLVARMVKALTALAVAEGRGVRFGLRGDAPSPEQRWDDPIESTAVALLALWQAGVRGEVIDGGVRWLLAHRVNGEVWRSTRDTAAAVELLAAYGSEQAAAGRLVYRIGPGREGHAGLQIAGEVAFDPQRMFEDGGALDVTGAALDDGNLARLSVDGPGAFGVNLTLTGFATGPAIAKRESGFRVERRFFRLDPVTKDGRVIHTRSEVTETMSAGTLLECELVVTTDRAREYVQVTSPYAAGFEPEREKALEVPGRAPAAQAETERFDDRVEFFVTNMAPGTHVFRHLARATHAGSFTALPARARLMYFPTVSGSSKGERLEITAAPETGGAK